MAAGLQIKHPLNGQVMFKVTDRITMTKGQITATFPSGSYSVPVESGQSVWAYLQDVSDQATTWGPNVWVSGNTVNWSYTNVGGNAICNIVYGTY